MFHRDPATDMIEDALRLATGKPGRGDTPDGGGPDAGGPEGKGKGQGVHVVPRVGGR